ncbi:hypothetical protein GFC29_1596 [Anoxybacillus sp. B7M1]|jgi:hypothetical protein|uniref:Uncharacterized protein n=1 Tax=Anoxybacteroides rupiense TaxID=311460 RepID=A0ABD5IUW9_9BACL|nr:MULTISPECIES: hypothetical protein [Anoxybacillus]ANB58030.1 hypothetical protein GFC28_29 [Anoxybacillus sp. B2M1]ANB63009.1 hypothetical protein GFC29_1596 [Anoxybacillus sp. B7M1]KXG11161.1 hypothetical protein AT864_00244 [Anoxybacillus sp. P3H1B]MBB3906739.1 hypothetical protein [Anoxybacillus rupiensis]MED5052109.1 hypothetical protein [Anoxybacillus rupiensis]
MSFTLYGVNPSDLIILEDFFQNQSKFISLSQKNGDFQAMVAALQQNGYTVSFKTVRTVELPVGKEDAVNPAIDLIVYNVYEESLLVGEAYMVSGPKQSIAFSVISNLNSTTSYYFIENNAVQRVVFDKNGNLYESTIDINLNDLNNESISIQQLSCETICTGLCSGGLAGSIPRCVAGCLATGPVGTPFCTVLCTLLVTFGCAYGCDALCQLI